MKPNTSKEFGAILIYKITQIGLLVSKSVLGFPSFFGGIRLVKPTIIVGSNYLVKGLGRRLVS